MSLMQDQIEALRQAIEQAEKQEPLCWVYNMNDLIHDLKTINYGTVYGQPVEGMTPLYTAPPKRDWVGLTDEERRSIQEWQRIQEELGPVWSPMMLYLYLAIEAKLKEKNQCEWIGLDHEQMRNTPIEFNRGALWAERYLKEKNYK